MYEYLKGIKNREQGFLMVLSGRTRGNGHTLKHFAPVRVTIHWHRLPEVLVKSPSQRYSKTGHGPEQFPVGGRA